MTYNPYQQQGVGYGYNDHGMDNNQTSAGAPGMGHEMSNYGQVSQYSQPDLTTSAPQPSATLSQQDFLDRVNYAKQQIQELNANIQSISALHQRALSAPDNSSSAQLEGLVTQTQLKNTQIRDQIKFLEADTLKTHDGTKGVKARQAKNVKNEFEKALKEYQQEELESRKKYRDQIARQYRIVNPEATEAEVEEASEMDWGSEGVFQTALKSNRSGQATSVLGAVRARHNELQRIETTLTQVAGLFAELAQIVENQDPVIEQTENNAQQTVQDVEKANVEIEKANDHARRTRRNKWWCLLVVVLIIVAIALGIGLGYGLTQANKK